MNVSAVAAALLGSVVLAAGEPETTALNPVLAWRRPPITLPWVPDMPMPFCPLPVRPFPKPMRPLPKPYRPPMPLPLLQPVVADDGV